MQCPRCQADNREGRRFCGECGAPLALACRSCGFSNEASEKFCGGCGTTLVLTPHPSRGTPQAPEAYTPAHLAERILASASALQGERKQVTVLFADLKGSTELIADLDPEEAQALLDGAVQVMLSAVHRYEGTVNQILGDGIMALFGAPLAHEDHAVRACYAALALQEGIRRYAEELRQRRGVVVQARVGLNSGEVVVRAIANDLRMDYSAVGPTVHLAARMEQLATSGSSLLTPATLRLVEGYVQVRSLGPTPVKGVAEVVEVYELLGTSQARTRLQAAAGRGLTRFVGRDSELEAVRRALERAGRGHGQVVALVGEPGVGKSRLVWEVIHSHRVEGWLVLEAGSVSYGKATSYLPVVDLLKVYCEIEGRDDTRRVREKLTGKLLTLDRALEPCLPALLALLDVPTEEPSWEALDPSQRRRETLNALKRLLLREAQVQPLLLVFEDLHWIDAETQALLDSLVESIPSHRLLLLVNYRPEYGHGWGSKSYYSQARIDPLPPESADELLASLLGDEASVQPLKPLLIERTEGNPLFLEESVRSLVETGALVGERGAYRLAQELPDIRVPATVQAVLAARIDRLPSEDKRLLQTAAVVGKDVPYALLQAIAERPEDDLRRGLSHLQAAEFLYEARLFPELEYTFKHALTHEVAYGSLLGERRRALHGRVVEAIERLYPERLAEQVERLAQHAERGEAWEKVVVYGRQAGLKARDHSAAFREAAGYFERALAALEHIPDDRSRCELAIDLRYDLYLALRTLAEIDRGLALLHEAETLASALGDQQRLSRVAAAMCNVFYWLGEHDRAVEAGERALAWAEALGDRDSLATARSMLAHAYRSRGEYRRAIESVTWALAALDLERSSLGRWIAVRGRTELASSLGELGEFTEATAQMEAAVEVADAAGQVFPRAFAGFGLGGVCLRQGRLERAIAVLERSVELCERFDFHSLFTSCVPLLGSAYTLAGRAAEAVPLLERGIALAETQGRRGEGSFRTAPLAEALLALGRHDEALAAARRALDHAVACREPGYEAWARRLLGEVQSQLHPPRSADAEASYRQSLALAEELGMRPLQAHCQLGLGKLYRRVGRTDEARTRLSTAVDLYRSMEMTLWLPAAEAELAELR